MGKGYLYPIAVIESRAISERMQSGPNPLIRLFLQGTAIGFALSAIFVAAIWILDIAEIHTHAQNSDDAFLLLFILWFFNGLLFGAVQIGYAVWQMGRDDG